MIESTIVIDGVEGEPINGARIALCVGGEPIKGQVSLNIDTTLGEVATVTVVLHLPKIEYTGRGAK